MTDVDVRKGMPPVKLSSKEFERRYRRRFVDPVLQSVERFLTTNLNEEKAANTKLNTVALRKGVNTKASNAA